MKYWRLTALAAVFCPGIVLADSSTYQFIKPPNPWKIDFSGGFLQTTGNTSSTTLNFKGNVDWHVDPWENVVNGLATSSGSSGKTTAETYQLGDQLTYDFTAKDYVFGSASYMSDRFAGIVERYSESVGYGRHVFHTDSQKLDLDIGVGTSEQRVAGSHHLGSEFIGVFDGNYVWKISDNARFKQTLHVEAGQTNTFVNPVSELKVTIIGNLYAALNYELRYNTTVPADSVHTDTISTVNIGYTFGEK